MTKLYDTGYNPLVIVIDRDLALMNAVALVFPHSHHMLCRRYISKNVESYVTKVFGDKESGTRFSQGRWFRVVHTRNQQEYEQEVFFKKKDMNKRLKKYLRLIKVCRPS